MKKLYDKSELVFAIILIIVYVSGSAVMKKISEAAGITFLPEFAFYFVLSAVIFMFAKKNGLLRHIGLCRPQASASVMLFYLPMLFIGSMSIFTGISVGMSPLTLALHTAMMVAVAFLEEVFSGAFSSEE